MPPGSTRWNAWFGLITQQAIRRGSFRSVRDLITRIQQFVEPYNQSCRPFCLDRYRRFHAPETCTPMWIYFRTTHSSPA